MSRNLTSAELDTIAALGFEVYMPETGAQTYAVYSDGNRLAYIERDYFGTLRTSTMHLPCRECGSGFQMDDGITINRETLERAFCHAPRWAMHSDRLAVRKWPSVAAWLASDRRINPYRLVRKGVIDNG